MLKELTQLWGVSGQEEQISSYIVDKIMESADSISIDAVGNTIALKKGYGENKKKIMVAAHMDEIGVCVVRIMDNGLLRVKQIGGISAYVAYMNRVEFKNGTVGMLACSQKIQDIKDSEMDKLYVDIGATSKEDAEKYVSVGDCAVIKGEYEELANRNVMAKAFDDRVACYILIKALQEMKNPYHDIYFTFTVQEEVGLRGATVAAERVCPDLGIAIDITRSFDIPGEVHGNPELGKGVAIKISDGSVLCDVALNKELQKMAEENNIPYQLDALYAGGTDIGAIMKSCQGVKTLGLSIPTRYGHTPHNIINLADVESCTELLKVLLESEISIKNEIVIK